MRQFCMLIAIAAVLCACGQRTSQTEGKKTTDSIATVVSQDSLMADVGNAVTV